MYIQSKYTKIFHSNSLTREKYDELHNFAVYLLNFKNKLSEEVNNNLFTYLETNKYTFITLMREKYKNEVNSSFDKQIYQQVLDCYQNKFEAINKKITFEKKTYHGFDFYKRTTKKHKKGDLKKVRITKEQTPLSICLSYLARYGNPQTIEYINRQLLTCEEKKKPYYISILRCIDRFGFDRLYSLATQRKTRVINYYSQTPVVFKSLSFSGRSRKKLIIDYNSRFGSCINAFISLSWPTRKTLDIPVRFNKDWHGRMRDYVKNTNDYEYTITFNEKTHQVKVHLCKDSERYIPEVNGETIGIDVNCKHNLFSLSDETTYDYDRKLVNDFCALSIKIDGLKKQDKEYKAGKRKQQKLNILKSKMVKFEQQLIATMCRTLQSKGVGHIVMENLDNGFGKSYIKDKDNEDINYNRKVKFLGLSSLKQEVEHIARKYDIAVSIVQASYTSKMCPVCGCIEDENRPDQETFSCIECGHKDNADFNAAKNIRNRVLVTVLRDKLLKQLDNGAYEPRKIKREKVKEVLLSYRTCLSKGRESEGDINFS